MPSVDLRTADIDSFVTDKPNELFWDSTLKGYGVRVTSSGTRSYVVQGRIAGQRSAIIVTIGRVSIYSEDDARFRARDMLQQMREGLDPRKLVPGAERNSPVHFDVKSAEPSAKNHELTDKLVNDLPASDSDKLYWDRQVAGFGVRVSPNGKRVYVVQGRVKGGKNLRMSLGASTLISTNDARAMAVGALRLMLSGQDPRELDQGVLAKQIAVAPGDTVASVELLKAKRQLAEAEKTIVDLKNRISELTDLVHIIDRERSELRAYLEDERKTG